jgi:uncharacterized protein YwgA
MEHHDKMNDYFGSVGIGFPKTEKQLENFNRVSKDYEFEGNEYAIDPVEILQSTKPVTNIDYHKRTVLAAEIVFQLQNENTIGHLKLQKLMYLCQHTTNMSLNTRFLKQAMGPYDPRLMRSIDKKLFENKWFSYTQGDFPQYKPLEEVGGHKLWYERYFAEQISSIARLIQIFRKARGEKVELVATIYACCLEAKRRKQIISDNLIIQKVYAWSQHKTKFSEETIKKAHFWMQQQGIYPR